MEDLFHEFQVFTFISPSMEILKAIVNLSPSMETTKRKREGVSQFQI